MLIVMLIVAPVGFQMLLTEFLTKNALTGQLHVVTLGLSTIKCIRSLNLNRGCL